MKVRYIMISWENAKENLIGNCHDKNCGDCENLRTPFCQSKFVYEMMLEEFNEHQIITMFKDLNEDKQQEILIKLSKIFYDGKRAF